MSWLTGLAEGVAAGLIAAAVIVAAMILAYWRAG
jgi:hypothetical protein